MDISHSITILEEYHVSPPPNSILTPSKIPLTFFDIPWFMFSSTQRVFFYEFSHTTLHFTDTVLPQLKHSLSVVLKHFYPLVGTVVCPSDRSDTPYILYQDGDSIPLIIAESNDEFSHLVQNYPRDVKEFHHLVPTLMHEMGVLSNTNQEEQEKKIRSLAAIQVTIFPNTGICLGYTFQHVVADGRAINHFIKSWASIFTSKNDLALSSQPLLDREKIIEDPNGYLPIVWNQWCDSKVAWDDFASCVSGTITPLDENLRATFVLSRVEIDKLKHKILSHFDTVQEQPPLPHVSTFVATLAFVWVCFIKTESIINVGSSGDDNLVYYFNFYADASERTRVPKTYFGNCLTPCYGSVSKSDLLGENGVFDAAKSLMKEIKELSDGNFKSPDSWLGEGAKVYKTGRMMTVAASPKLRVYETDFGWGKPRKSELVHIDQSGSISYSESRNEEGGVEIGVALSKAAMDIFTSIFDSDQPS